MVTLYTHLIIQVEKEGRILTVIYLSTLICFLVRDKLPSVLAKIFMLANSILKIMEKINKMS